MNTDSIKNRFAQVFENDYQGYEYFIENVVNLIFTGDDAYEPLPVPEEFLTDEKRQRANESGILSILKVGTVDAEEPVDLYDITLSDKKEMQYNRVGIQQFIRSELFSFTNAFMLFHNETPEGKDWRFSYAYKETTQKSMTSAKRYTYLFGKNHRARTASERFAKLAGEDKNTQNLLNAFSVEALSKDFFNEYKNQYNLFCKFISDHKNNPEFFGSKMAYWEDKSLRDYVKKMMGRITFIYFLQRKGWINGDMQYMQNAFQKSPHQDDYLDMFLEPLFFGVLNTKQKDRKTLFEKEGWDLSLLKEWKDVPYLNGGLFERDEHDQPKSKFPSEMFKNLFDFYSRYNFTIDENDPDDAEVGVDPEMLGHIFENLLEDNKDKGAFYTPKEIVQYMCRESLIAYLTNCAEENTGHKYPHEQTETHVRTLVQTPEQIVPKMSHRQKEDFGKALQEVKICDPAIGSGAFPMGLLNELVRLRISIGAWADKANDIAALKREIIQNNIYGVDIEKGAVDIARLRFWLSIVVDSEQPEALPNFDYKFMQGNSLLECCDGVDLSRMLDNEGNTSGRGKKKSKAGENQLGLEFVSADTKRNLQLKLHDYFNMADHEQKLRQRNSINESVKNYICQLGISSSAEEKLSALDPSANQEFFLWHTWFKDVLDNGGFDIVIGNPPYINIANIEDEVYRNQLKSIFRSTRNKCDLYAYFIEKSFQLTSKNGIVAFIVPVTWKATDSFSKLREIIFKEHSVQQVVNLDIGVFKAIVLPMIVVFSSEHKTDYSIKIYNKEFGFLYDVGVSEILSSSTLSLDTETPFYEKKLLQKIEQVDNRLGDIIKFSRGIKTSDDKRFIGYEQKSSEYKKVYRGRHIRPYYFEWAGEYIWYRPDLMKEKVGCLPHSSAFFEVPEKLVMQRIGMQLSVAYDDKQNYFLDTTNVSRYESINKNYSLKFICGLLNSKLVNFWYTRRYKLPTIGGYELDTIPVPNINLNQQTPIINLVSQILQFKNKDHDADITALQYQIDKRVYELYGLTEEEMKVVEGR